MKFKFTENNEKVTEDARNLNEKLSLVYRQITNNLTNHLSPISKMLHYNSRKRFKLMIIID